MNKMGTPTKIFVCIELFVEWLIGYHFDVGEYKESWLLSLFNFYFNHCNLKFVKL